MTKQEFATLVVAMQAMYGKDFIGTEEALDVWYALLHDLDYQMRKEGKMYGIVA